MSIVVIGSFMMDLVVNATRAPEAGETLIGKQFNRFPGGKGANQAVAARRLGAEVKMVGKVGRDEFGGDFIKLFQTEGIDVQQILMDDTEATGVGSIVIEDGGQNRIVVVPGANLAYSKEEIELIEQEIAQAKLLVMQLEMNIETIEYSAYLAHKHHVPVLLNPAPAQKLSGSLLARIDYLTPNETELALLTDTVIETIDDVQKAARQLIQQGVSNVIVTLAEKGALLCTDSETKMISGYRVKAIDTVAAGDAFNAALATKLTAGYSVELAIQYANAVGALTVTKAGAIPSLPTVQEVEVFIKSCSADIAMS